MGSAHGPALTRNVAVERCATVKANRTLRRILDRYILKEVVLTWLAVTGVLLIILLTNQLAHWPAARGRSGLRPSVSRQ
jgi:hypothetical protein